MIVAPQAFTLAPESFKRNTTSSFPARQYSVNGERRSFTLLRPALDNREGQERIKTLILEEDPKLETAVSQVVR